MERDFEYSLKPAIYLMKLMGIQMNVSGKDRLISRCLVGIVGIALSFATLCYLIVELTGYLDVIFHLAQEKRKDILLEKVAQFGLLCGKLEHLVFTHLIIFLFSLTSTWTALWSALQVIQTCLQLDDGKFHRKLRKESFLALGLFFSSLLAFGLCENNRHLYGDSLRFILELIIGMVENSIGQSVLVLFSILVSTARLLLERLDERVTEIIEKSNNAADASDPPGDDYELGLSMELDEWRCQYELVSRWIDRLDSCFGLLILLELATFVLFSFYFFWRLLLAYVTVGIHMRYETYGIASYANKIERLIGRPLLGGFPLGDHHISKAKNFCKLRGTLLQDMSNDAINQMYCWLRLLIILIPTYRMKNQNAGLFDTFRQFKSRLYNSPLQLQLHNLRLQVIECSSTVTAAHVVNDLGPSFIPAVIAATIEFGLTLFEIAPAHRELKDAEPSLELMNSFFANKTWMLQVLSEVLSTSNQTVPLNDDIFM